MLTKVTKKMSETLGVHLIYGDIILDIPESHKDQIDNLYVMDETDGEHRFRDIRMISPIAKAIGEAFRFWARRIRVFVSSRAFEKIKRKHTSEKLVRSRVRVALDDLAGQTMPLPFDKRISPRQKLKE